MTTDKPIGVGIIGLGFMGRTHAAAYADANRAGFPNRLVAVYDRKPGAASKTDAPKGNLESGDPQEHLFTGEHVRQYASPLELLSDPNVELVSICTPTETHVELAIAALQAGKHVLVEKPIALSSDQVVHLAEAAREAKTLCMPAMCMRFWPSWSWLKQAIDAKTFGAVQSAEFRRLGAQPNWSPEFYKDPERTGGALFDLHVHDADFVRWCFGAPDSVTSIGTLDHVITTYHYPNGPQSVIAEGAWVKDADFEFQMRYSVVFEHATADFDLGRDTPLLLDRDRNSEVIELESGTGYDGEIRHLLQACRAKSPELHATIDDAVQLTRMLEAERANLR
ncbi:MAG: putative dehydrogenase [Planctomycetota bacterium]|jgi:predicted dehydrogenase